MKPFTRWIFVTFILVISFNQTSFAQERSNKVNEPTQIAIGGRGQKGLTPFPDDKGTQRIIRRKQILDEGDRLVEQRSYGEAVKKYQEALDASLLNYERDKILTLMRIVSVYKMQGEYAEPLRIVKELISQYPEAKGQSWLDEKLELESLIRARDSGSPEPIYEHIRYLRGKYKDQLPPKTCVGLCDTIFSTVVRLYDHIGDLDGGIAFADEFIRFYAKLWNIRPEELQGPNSKHQYFLIKQEFLKDKAEGRKSCIAAKPGEVCMGRATQALIQSDYFPW